MGSWEFSVYVKQERHSTVHPMLYIREREGRERAIKGRRILERKRTDRAGQDMQGREEKGWEGKENGRKE